MKTHATAVQNVIIELAKCVTELRSQLIKVSFEVSEYTKQAMKQTLFDLANSQDNSKTSILSRKTKSVAEAFVICEDLEGYANFGTYECQNIDEVLGECVTSAEAIKNVLRWLATLQADPVRNVPLKEIADELDYWCENE